MGVREFPVLGHGSFPVYAFFAHLIARLLRIGLAPLQGRCNKICFVYQYNNGVLAGKLKRVKGLEKALKSIF